LKAESVRWCKTEPAPHTVSISAEETLDNSLALECARLARDICAVRDIELALHVAIIGDRVAPFMAPPDTDPAVARKADSLAILPDDPAAAVEEIQRRREEIGFSYVVIGADFADKFAPVVAELSGR